MNNITDFAINYSHKSSDSIDTTDALKIASINVNSLISLSKRTDLYSFVTDNNLDVVLICETKLSQRYKIQFSNYDLIRVDRPNSQKGGGTAILIRKNIPYNIVFSPSSNNNVIIEYTIINIKMNNSNLYLIALYANNNVSRIFSDEINQLFVKLKLDTVDNYYIIAGNFNARHTAWGDSVDRRKGILLKKWIDNEGIGFKAKVIPPSQPTFPSTNSFLDLCILDVRLLLTDTIHGKINVHDYNSDHKALIFTVSLKHAVQNVDPSCSYRFTFKKTNWNKFQKHIIKNHNNNIPFNRNLTNSEITDYLLQLQQTITNSIESIVPKYKPRDNMLYYVNRKMSSLHKSKSLLISILNKLYKLNTHNVNSNNRIDYIKSLINEINKNIKSEYMIAYNKYWECQFRAVDHRNPDAFFPKINRFFRPKQQLKIQRLEVDQTDTPLLERAQCNIDDFHINNNKFIVENPDDILNIIGAYYEKINSPRFTNINTEHKAHIDNVITQIVDTFQNNLKNNITVTHFNETNTAINPVQPDDTLIFTNTY